MPAQATHRQPVVVFQPACLGTCAAVWTRPCPPSLLLLLLLLRLLLRHPPPARSAENTQGRQAHITDKTSTSRHNTDANNQLNFVKPPGTRSRHQPSAFSQPPAASHGLPSPSRAAVSPPMAHGVRTTTCDYLSHDHPPVSTPPVVPWGLLLWNCLGRDAIMPGLSLVPPLRFPSPGIA